MDTWPLFINYPLAGHRRQSTQLLLRSDEGQEHLRVGSGGHRSVRRSSVGRIVQRPIVHSDVLLALGHSNEYFTRTTAGGIACREIDMIYAAVPFTGAFRTQHRHVRVDNGIRSGIAVAITARVVTPASPLINGRNRPPPWSSSAIAGVAKSDNSNASASAIIVTARKSFDINTPPVLAWSGYGVSLPATLVPDNCSLFPSIMTVFERNRRASGSA